MPYHAIGCHITIYQVKTITDNIGGDGFRSALDTGFTVFVSHMTTQQACSASRDDQHRAFPYPGHSVGSGRQAENCDNSSIRLWRKITPTGTPVYKILKKWPLPQYVKRHYQCAWT